MIVEKIYFQFRRKVFRLVSDLIIIIEGNSLSQLIFKLRISTKHF